MAKFKKSDNSGSQSINTASLPDIVFMLLFFFMVVTKMKDTEVKVSIKLPKASEIVTLESKQTVSYLYIGKPKENLQETFGTSTRIQLNDAFKETKDIPFWVESEKKKIPPADMPKFVISIKADNQGKMGIISDVKQKLREINALKIMYSAAPGKTSYDVK